MIKPMNSDVSVVIIGLGKTGVACARYFSYQGISCAVVDSRSNPPGLATIRKELPDTPVHTGSFQSEWLRYADTLVVSPGVSLSTPEITEAIERGCDVIGDIELFCRATSAPVIAITGSNGKSTVTALLGRVAECAGVDVAVGGNIGVPALELLELGPKDLYILELSSFQLETLHSLNAAAATVLNISPDHMDRYPSMEAYTQAKQRIYSGCLHAVVNEDDPLSFPITQSNCKVTRFGMREPQAQEFGLRYRNGQAWFSFADQYLMPVNEMKIKGLHNQANALAVLALAQAAELPQTAALEAIRNFEGLPHRCQWVTSSNGVDWFNDSKATNVGAAIAAIEGLGPEISGKLVVILGGDGKGADFSELIPPLKKYTRKVVLIGNAGNQIAGLLSDEDFISAGFDFKQAIQYCAQIAQPGDAVLLAPACASFDMFDSYEQRGEKFIEAVRCLINEH